MIAQLTGRVEALEDGRCVIDVNGVGYLVHASTRTLAALPAPPADARLLVETHVREDAILLYGFADSAERDWFRLLTTVQGVGGRVALSVLSALSPRELVVGDRRRRPGQPDARAGRRRTARGPRADRAARQGRRHAQLAGPRGVAAQAPAAWPRTPLSALVNLGYRRPEAQPAVVRVIERLGDAAPLDAVIRDSLKELARGAAG